MDFIERLFGVSPDNGSGVFEVLLFGVPSSACTFSTGSDTARNRANPE
jgi:hypothetical protein